MAAWTTITIDDLKASTHGSVVDSAQTIATGDVDPVQEAIDNIIAEVRSAVRAGNRLDTDSAKIPTSLKRLAMRLVIFALMARLGLKLEESEAAELKSYEKRLERLFDRKLQVEPADSPDVAAGPVNPGIWNSEPKVIGRMHPVPLPGNQATPGKGYANSEAPEDLSE
ncbi:MAG TPA: hypothetical protein VF614_06570 [Chthoniobacteraceae bacterium]|jgi:hypothetical protein